MYRVWAAGPRGRAYLLRGGGVRGLLRGGGVRGVLRGGGWRDLLRGGGLLELLRGGLLADSYSSESSSSLASQLASLSIVDSASG